MRNIIEEIISTFENRGHEKYGNEAVTQLQHALQAATLAEADHASFSLITAALLHDIGHIIHQGELPQNNSENLHDLHEEIGYLWLLEHFGERVARPVKLHVEAKRYLCTTDKAYANKLSPTSLKSFHDQGGKMDHAEIQTFEKDPYFKEAVQLRIWDDQAKATHVNTPPINHFVQYLQRSLAGKS